METESARVAVRSCLVCAKAKARCVRRLGEDVCERCARLKKECHSKEPTQRRRKPAKTTRAAQLEKLENKIEHLVNALSTQQPVAARSEYGQLSPPVSQASNERLVTRSNELLNTLCAGPDEHLRTTILEDKTNARGRIVTLSEAELLLTRYRQSMSAGMPFVALPPTLTAHEMYTKKPALLRAITTVAMFHDLPRQQTQVRELIRDLSERIMIKGEKSIDVLQAIIVFVTWAHPHMYWTQQVTNLLHLATAITIDTSIDRSTQQPACIDLTTPRTDSLEEHRILLGLFYLSSTLSSSFRKIDSTPFTRQMEICLHNLDNSSECESDLLLVQTVRIQRVIESIHSTNLSGAPAKIYRKAFQADLAKLRQMDPCKEDNTFLRLHYLSAEIQIWGLSLNEVLDDSSKPLTSVLIDLYSLVSAIKTFNEMFFTIPASAYLLAPFAVFGQYAHAFIALTKLTTLELEGWDVDTLNHEINLLDVIDESARRFTEAARSSVDGVAVDSHAFGKWAQRIKYMKTVFGSKFGDANGRVQGEHTTAEKASRPSDDMAHPTPPDEIMNADFFSSLDVDFWSAIDFTTDLGFTSTDQGHMLQ